MALFELFNSQKIDTPTIDILQYIIDKKTVVLLIFVIQSKTSDFTIKIRSKLPLRILISIVNKVILNNFFFFWSCWLF